MTDKRGSGVYDRMAPDHRWPTRWWTTFKEPEPVYPVELSCGCLTEFEDPTPPARSAVLCRHHGPVRVAANKPDSR